MNNHCFTEVYNHTRFENLCTIQGRFKATAIITSWRTADHYTDTVAHHDENHSTTHAQTASHLVHNNTMTPPQT